MIPTENNRTRKVEILILIILLLSKIAYRDTIVFLVNLKYFCNTKHV